MSRAITAVKMSSSYWHPVWEKHYLPHFDHAEVLLLDADKYPHGHSTWRHITALLNAELIKLLRKYDLVMVIDIDEIIVPNPDKYNDLGDYLDRFEGKYIRAIGYNVVQADNAEPFDINKKITNQRKRWSRDKLYDKPVLTRIPFLYTEGQHNCSNVVNRDEDLILFHLRDANREIAIRNRSTNMKGYKSRYAASVEIPKKWRII